MYIDLEEENLHKNVDSSISPLAHRYVDRRNNLRCANIAVSGDCGGTMQTRHRDFIRLTGTDPIDPVVFAENDFVLKRKGRMQQSATGDFHHGDTKADILG
ncbi:hypothetical protein V6Z90_004178 [Aspergillus fumigatus]